MAAVLGGAALVLGLSVGLMLWISSGPDKKPGSADPPEISGGTQTPPPKEPPPPDPRLKIVQPAVDRGVAYFEGSPEQQFADQSACRLYRRQDGSGRSRTDGPGPSGVRRRSAGPLDPA